MGFPGDAVVKNLPTHAGDTGVQSLGQEDALGWDPLQGSCLENPMDRGAWWATVQGVTESDTTRHAHIHVTSDE